MEQIAVSRAVVHALNVGRRSGGGRVSTEELRSALGEASAEGDALGAQVATNLPILARVEGAVEAREAFERAMEEQRTRLESVVRLLDQEEHDLVLHALDTLEEAAQGVTDAVVALRRLHDRVPRLSDVPLINEIYTLSLNAMKGHTEAGEALRARLHGLYEFTRFLERARAQFAVRNPDEKEILAASASALESLRQAAGGFVVYLEEGRTVDLSHALSLLDGAVGPLGACIKAMKMVEFNLHDFSEHPALQALHDAARALAEGRPLPPPPPPLSEDDRDKDSLVRALEDLEAFHEAMGRDLKAIDEQAFLGLARKSEAVEKMRHHLEDLAALRAQAWDERHDAEELTTIVERLREVGTAFDDEQRALEEAIAQRPDLSAAGHIHDLAERMRGVWAGHVSDRLLQEKAEMLRNMQGVFRARLQLEHLHASADGQDTTPMASVAAALDQQRAGLELVLAYLENGDRQLLLQAWDHLEPSALDLMEVRAEADSVSQETEVTCLFCGATAPSSATRCTRCARVLPTTALQSPQSGFQVYEGGGASGADEEEVGANIAFVAQVIDDVTQGRITPTDAAPLVGPFHQTALSVEQRLAALQPQVEATQFDALVQSNTQMLSVVSQLRQVTEQLVGELEAGNDYLEGFRDVVVDLARQLGHLQKEAEAAQAS